MRPLVKSLLTLTLELENGGVVAFPRDLRKSMPTAEDDAEVEPVEEEDDDDDDEDEEVVPFAVLSSPSMRMIACNISCARSGLRAATSKAATAGEEPSKPEEAEAEEDA